MQSQTPSTKDPSMIEAPTAGPLDPPIPSLVDDKTPPSSKQPDPSEANYNPKSLSFWLVIGSVYLCFFLIALDRLIIATAIPSITNTFNSIADIGWYGSAYMLTCAIFNPIFGKVYQLYDTKWVYLTSIAIFEVGSALCGAAPSSIALVVGRAIAGIGAAGISSGAIMIIVPLVPLHKRPLYTSFFGMSFAVSSVLGPIIGGSFTDSHKLTWRWCFYINLPIGAVTMLGVFIFLKLPSPPKEKVPLLTQFKRLDPLGLFFFIPSVICLILALQWGGTTKAWSDAEIIGLLVTFAVTFIAFLVVEFKLPDTAIAPPRIVLNRSIAGSMFFIFTMYGGMINAVYYLSIWFQAAQGQSAMHAGIRTIPLVLALVVCGIASAALTQKIGYYVPALLVSPIFAATGSGLLSTLTPSSGRAAWIGYQVLYGIGLGTGAQTSSLAAQTVLAPSDVALGTSLNFFVQQIGGAMFLAVGQNIFSRALVTRLAGIAGLNTQAIINTGVTDLRKVVPANEIDVVVDSYSRSLTRAFLLTAALSALMILGALAVEWKSIKKDKQKKKLGDVVLEDAEKDAEKNTDVEKKELQ